MKKDLMFSLVADGTHHQFAAFRQIACPYERKKITQLEFYRNYVNFRNSPRVYILDNTGKVMESAKS